MGSLQVSSKRSVSLFVLALFLLIAAPFSFGQSITGDILGTVTDPSGGSIQGAKVTLTATDTNITFNGTTDENGNYFFAQLKPGRYSVSIEKDSFSTATVSGIELLVGQRSRVDVSLKVGAVMEKVDVNAGGVVQLETETSSICQTIQEKVVQNLPIQNRNFVELITLAAGVAPIGEANSPASSWTGAGNGQVTTSVAGLRESNMSFLVNGIESRNARFGSANLRPSFDAIQEVKVQTNNFTAEYGRSAAVVNTTIRSGTNQFHGDVYNYFRNDALNANDIFSIRNQLPRGVVRYNNFGGSIGGPVIIPHLYNGKDKTFFFFNYEGFRNPTLTNLQGLVPSAAQLAGDLSDDSAGTGFFPTSSSFCASNSGSAKCVDVIDPSTGDPFPGNVIPSNRLDATSQKFLEFWAVPNIPNTSGSNFVSRKSGFKNWDQYTFRIDHALTKRDQLWGSFTHDDRPTVAPGLLPLSGSSWPLADTLLTVTETHVFSPTVVNEARFGYNRGRTYLVGEGALGPNYARDVFGFQNTSDNSFDFGVPNAGIPGFNTPGSPAESIGALDENFQWVDNLSIAKGKHSLVMGINYIHEKFYQVTDFGGIPFMNFSGRFTGVGLGDFLLGDIDSATASVGDSSQDLRSNYYGGFFQDNWHIGRNFTLNLGIRYEYQQTPYDTSSKTAWFDPEVRDVVYSRSGKVRKGIVDPDHNNFAPRIGFSYSPTFLPNTVIRGGGGVFFATDNWNELQFLVIAPEFSLSQTLTSNPTTPTLHYGDLFPAGTLGGGTANPFSVNKFNRTPYVEQWNLDVQHTFGDNWRLVVGYVGDTGRKLPQRRNRNAPLSFDLTGTIPIQDRVPFPEFGWILEAYNGGWSSYHGLAARAEKRFSSGFYFLGSYTWSHAIDVGGTDDFSLTSTFPEFDKGNGDYDVRHRAVFSYVYELPFGRGKHFLGGVSGIADHILSGWQLNGIATFSTGQYSTPTLPLDWINFDAFSTSTPDLVGNPIPQHRTDLQYFDMNAFVLPGCTTLNPVDCTTGLHRLGTARRNTLEQPGINNWDMGLTKRTRISERVDTEFRVEAYNVWNHTQWGNANTSLSGNFGKITTLRMPPRALQLALKISF
jgi:hypothetical protein